MLSRWLVSIASSSMQQNSSSKNTWNLASISVLCLINNTFSILVALRIREGQLMRIYSTLITRVCINSSNSPACNNWRDSSPEIPRKQAARARWAQCKNGRGRSIRGLQVVITTGRSRMRDRLLHSKDCQLQILLRLIAWEEWNRMIMKDRQHNSKIIRQRRPTRVPWRKFLEPKEITMLAFQTSLRVNTV